MRRPKVSSTDRGLIRALVHRGARADQSPPVAARTGALHDPTVCERCGAVYHAKTWRTRERVLETARMGVHWVVCPACRQVEGGEYFGRVEVRGAFAAEHEAEIRRRVAGVAARARVTQPERRVVSIEPGGSGFDVLTTSQKLAHRIARELTSTFGGHAVYSWWDRDGELRATWRREEAFAPPVPPRRTRAGRRHRVDLEIQARGIDLDPAWRELIEGAVARLTGRFPELIRIHVTTTHARHHRHGTEKVAVVANLPGATLRAEKQEDDVPAALHAAFAALTRELDAYHRERGRA
jgi:ribosomal subunit interface protein